MSSWISELLEALERHSQALQANTAAVHSLFQAGPRAAAADPDALQRRLAEQLEQGRELAARLEALRRELRQPAPASFSVCGASGVGGMCRLEPSHTGGHEFS